MSKLLGVVAAALCISGCSVQRGSFSSPVVSNPFVIARSQPPRAPAFNGSCQQIEGWLSDTPWPETPASRRPNTVADADIVALIGEPRFSSHFGKPYVQMSDDELRPYTASLLGACFIGPLRDLSPRKKSAAYDALVYSHRQDNLAKAERQVRESKALDDQIQRIQAYAANERDYNELAAIADGLDGKLATLPPERRDAYSTAVASAQERVALPFERTRVDELLSTPAKGSVPALLNEQDRQRKHSYSPAVNQQRAENVRRLDASVTATLSAEMADQRKAIDSFADGLNGLAQGSRWNAQFQRRYEPLATRSPVIRDTIQYFSEKRQTLLARSQPAFTRELAATSDPESVASRYLVSLDRSTSIGKQYWDEVAARQADVRKWRILGSDPNKDRRAAKSFPDEPTEGEMYDALTAHLQGIAATTRNLSNCDVSGKTNPADGLMCLMFKGMNATGAGSPTSLTRFEKLGCAKPTSKYGFVCTYIAAMTGGVMSSPLLGSDGGLTQRLMQSESRNTAVFGKSKDGWYFEKLPEVEVIRRD